MNVEEYSDTNVDEKLRNVQKQLKEIVNKRKGFTEEYQELLRRGAEVDESVMKRQLAIRAKVKKMYIQTFFSAQRNVEKHILKYEMMKGINEIKKLETILDDAEIDHPPLDIEEFESAVLEAETDAEVDIEFAKRSDFNPLESVSGEFDSLSKGWEELEHIEEIQEGQMDPSDIDPLEGIKDNEDHSSKL